MVNVRSIASFTQTHTLSHFSHSKDWPNSDALAPWFGHGHCSIDSLIHTLTHTLTLLTLQIDWPNSDALAPWFGHAESVEGGFQTHLSRLIDGPSTPSRGLPARSRSSTVLFFRNVKGGQRSMSDDDDNMHVWDDRSEVWGTCACCRTGLRDSH